MCSCSKHARCSKVLFTGTYDITSATSTINTLAAPFNLKHHNTDSIMNDFFYYTSLKNEPTNKYLNDNFTFSSSDKCGKNIGEIRCSALYQDTGTGGISVPQVITNCVLGGSGIYKNVTSVIIDFRNPIRKVYFLGK